MSKTSEESSARRVAATYWKRFAASGTAFARKYRYDPFVRTELNVLGLQILFTFFVLFVVAEGVSLLYEKISSELISSIVSIIKSPGSTPGTQIANNLDALRIENLVVMGAIIAIGAAVFAYLVTRLALSPTRNALEAQKQFIGNIAHELRTPLSIIKTNTEVALFDTGMAPALHETLTDTIDELDRISDIINNLLSLNALVRPEKVPFANVDIAAVVERMHEHLEHLIAKKHLAFAVTRGDYATVWGNATALEQIVMNVLKNAVNYTPNGGTIAVSIAPDYRGSVMVSVKDSGIGIEEKDLGRIFEPFFRADQSRTRVTGGSGLGLAIVSELVKLHRGSIAIRSAKGMGTTVTISIPCGREPKKKKRGHEGGEIAINYSAP